MKKEIFKKLTDGLRLDEGNSDIYNVAMTSKYRNYEIDICITESDNFKLYIEYFGTDKKQYEPTEEQKEFLSKIIKNELFKLEMQKQREDEQIFKDIEDQNRYGISGALYSSHY